MSLGLFCLFLFGFAPGGLQAAGNNLRDTFTAIMGVFLEAGGVFHLGLAGGTDLSLADEYRRNLDLDTAEYRDLPIFRGNEKPKSGGPEFVLGFDWNRFFILYSGRLFLGNVDTTVYSAAPPFQTADVRTTSYKDAGMNPRDLIFGARFFRGNHVIQVHGGVREMLEDTTFTERNAPLVPGAITRVTDAASNRFDVRTTGILLGAGYRYQLPIIHLFAELSAFSLRGSYSMRIASFESLGSAAIRELSVDTGRAGGYGAEAMLGAALGKRFGPRLGIRRTMLRMNLHREIHASYDLNRAVADLTGQALYLSRVRNKRGISTSADSAFIEMRFATDFDK